jgi:hypothetical protein
MLVLVKEYPKPPSKDESEFCIIMMVIDAIGWMISVLYSGRLKGTIYDL